MKSYSNMDILSQQNTDTPNINNHIETGHIQRPVKSARSNATNTNTDLNVFYSPAATKTFSSTSSKNESMYSSAAVLHVSSSINRRNRSSLTVAHMYSIRTTKYEQIHK